MKLWYQSFVKHAERVPYGDLLRKTFAMCTDADTEIDLHGIEESSGFGVHHPFLEHNDVREVMQNAMRAEREGYDAFLIGNSSDAGIREARELVNIPVLGLSETALHIACMMGATFGLMTVSERWTLRNLENVRRAGLESRLVGCVPLNSSPLGLREAMEDTAKRARVMEDFMAGARELIRRGAEVIIPEGGDIIVFLAEDGIFEIDGAPVLNGIFELIKMGEVAVKLRKISGGRFKSKRLSYAPPTGDFLQKVRAFYGPDVYPGAT
jgi:allantoin racemase